MHRDPVDDDPALLVRRFGPALRSPVGAIAGATRLVLDTDLEPDQRRWLESVESSTDELAGVIGDLFDVVEAQSGTLGLVSVPFRPADVIGEAVRACRVESRERGVPVVVHRLVDLPDLVVGDPGRLRQILVHLVRHAVHASATGTVAVAAAAEPGGDGHVLRVAVRGPAEGLFDDASAPGLWISDRLVAAMGGELVVRSGSGASVCAFGLPYGKAERLQTPVASVPERPVAVIGDASARGLAEVLRSGGHEVVEIDSVDDAVAAGVSGASPGLVVVAAASFAEVARLRTATSDTPLLVVVEQGERGDAAECIRLGVDGYLPRPVSPVDLLDAVNELLTRDRGPLVTRHTLREHRRRFDILVADDSPTARAVLMRSLESLGHEVSGAATGREALDMGRSRRFEVVLMDVEMPDLDGLEATRAWREREGPDRHTPIIGVSAHAFSADRRLCLEAGMDEQVTKPFRIEELNALLGRIIPAPVSS